MKTTPSIFLTVLIAVASLGSMPHASAQFVFTELNDPATSTGFGTIPWDVSGNQVAGWYLTSSGSNGFFYNGSTCTSIIDPSGTNNRALGFFGNGIFGTYSNSIGNQTGFLYDGTTYTTIRPPSATGDVQILGSSAQGIYGEANGQLFLYNGTSYATVAQPSLPSGAAITGTDGTTFYGDIMTNGISQGFVYNGSTLTIIKEPLASDTNPTGQQTTGTEIGHASGSDVVGLYIDDGNVMHGFLFNGTTYTTIDNPNFVPGGLEAVTGVDGDNLVGYYLTLTGYHGFEATAVPEPSSLVLLGLGLLGLGLLRSFALRTNRR